MIRARVSQSPVFPAWFWLLPIAAFLLFYETALSGLGNPSERIVWYSVLSIVGAAALTRVCRVQKQFDVFDPLHLTLALFVIFYPLRALLAVWLDDSWFDPAQAAIWKALSAALLGFVSFAAGYKIGLRKLVGRRMTWLDRSWNPERAKFISLWFLVIGISGFLAMYFLSGSLVYFISLNSDIKAPESIKAWFFYVLWICVFLQVGALIQLGSWLSTSRRTFWTALYCVLALGSTLLLSRHFTVLFLTMLVLCWHYQKRKIRAIQIAVMFFLLLSYLALAGLYREWISPGYDLDEAAGLAELAGQQNRLVLRYVVGNLEQLSNLSEVISMTPSELPYQFGSTFTPVFLKPIPRAWMPAKPLGASAVFSRQLIPEAYDSGLVTGLGGWGEWYLNFSWFGISIGMALTGALTAATYKAMRATNGFGRVLLYLSFVVLLFTWLRNDFNSAATFGLYYFAPAILALAYVTNTQPGAKQAMQLKPTMA